MKRKKIIALVGQAMTQEHSSSKHYEILTILGTYSLSVYQSAYKPWSMHTLGLYNDRVIYAASPHMVHMVRYQFRTDLLAGAVNLALGE